MLDALRGLLPSLFGYVFGFWVIGTYWANHHYVFSLYKRSNHAFALLNVASSQWSSASASACLVRLQTKRRD